MLPDNETEPRLKSAILLLKENGDILDANQSCSDTLDWAREELIGQNIKAVLQSGRDVLLTRLVETQGSDREPTGDTTFSVRVRLRKKSGEVFPAVITVRRFLRLGWWTAAFHPWNSEGPIPPVAGQETVESQVGSDEVSEQTTGLPAFSNDFDLSSEINKPAFRNTALLIPAAALKLNSRDETQFTDVSTSSIFSEQAHFSGRQPIADESSSPAVEVSNISNESDRGSSDLEVDRDEERKIEHRASALSTHFQTLLQEVNETLEAERTYQKRIHELEEREKIRQADFAKLREELEEANAKRLSAEAQISGLIDRNASLRIDQTQLEEAKKTLQNIRDEVESQLQSCRSALKETRQTLEEQTMERQKLELLLSSTRSDLEAKCEDWRLEAEKLKVALELQRIEQRVDQAGGVGRI